MGSETPYTILGQVNKKLVDKVGCLVLEEDPELGLAVL